MQTPEQIEERLKQYHDEKWGSAKLKSIKKLPKSIQETSRTLIGVTPNGKKLDRYSDRGNRAVCAMQAELTRMSATKRSDLIRSLFPKLAPSIEAAWNLHCRLPYQDSWPQRPFRTSNEKIIRTRQVDWLCRLIQILQGFPEDAIWLAQWTGHIPTAGYGREVGLLLAAVIDEGGSEAEQIVEILKESAAGEHEIGRMGRHVNFALLCTENPDCWTFMEKFLLAAQRQEGLRQSILETVDAAHPGAFRRMLKLIVNENLARFASVVRAADVWFGLLWDSASGAVVKKLLARVIGYLGDPQARDKAIATGDAEETFFALWAIGFVEVLDALEAAKTLLSVKDVERRFAAVHFLSMLKLVEAQQALLPMVADEDLRVAQMAVWGTDLDDVRSAASYKPEDAMSAGDLFERLEREIERFPKKKTKQKALLFPWLEMAPEQRKVASAMTRHLGKRPATRLISLLPHMDADARIFVAGRLVREKKRDAETRAALFELAGDASSYVRSTALEGLRKCTPEEGEAEQLEALLTRKAAELRRGVFAILLKQDKAAMLATVDRLLASGNLQQRRGGLEFMRQLIEGGRFANECRERATQYAETRKRISREESIQLEAILDGEVDKPTLDDALGLMDPTQCTPPPIPQKRDVQIATPAVINCITSLHAVVEEHRQTPIKFKAFDGECEELLGNFKWNYPSPNAKQSREENLTRWPLAEVWRQWYENRPDDCRDDDGFEILRMNLAARVLQESFHAEKEALRELRKKLLDGDALEKLKGDYLNMVGRQFEWLLYAYPPQGGYGFLIEALEQALSHVHDAIQQHIDGGKGAKSKAKSVPELSKQQLAKLGEWRGYDSPINGIISLFYWMSSYLAKPSPEDLVRFWRLELWIDRPGYRTSRHRSSFERTLAAFLQTVANENDLIDALIGPREDGFSDLQSLTGPKFPDYAKEVAELPSIVDRCRLRVIEVELARGEEPTAASRPARSLSTSGHSDVLIGVLTAMAKAKLKRGYQWGEAQLTREAVFSHLIRVSSPGPDDTPQKFAKQVKAAEIEEQRLIDIAFFAPQWAAYIEHAIRWPGFEEGVWWIHAHTKDEQWAVERHIREAWKAEVGQRTPLSVEDLVDGAVDVDWFNKVIGRLKKPRWARLLDSAKYASGGGGHKRAELFASAMLGLEKKTEFVKRIEEKRHKDVVRALGLLPLPKAAGPKEKDLLGRYRIIQEFLRTRRQFGSQRQESEKRAANIGLENLARTAGFRDPIRLQWAMEAKEFADLASGPASISAADTTVTLSIEDDGAPTLTVEKKGKLLKNIPPAARKDARVIELRDRRTAAKRQSSRIRKSLEEMMCRGDAFSGAELVGLFDHALLAPLLARLVIVGEGILGYPVKGGKALEDFSGKLEPVKKGERLRIAHPHDLLTTEQWSHWQQDCFARERMQPFKQMFRELYVVTEAERREASISRRYAGHQVHPRQAMALLGGRGWITAPDQGVFRTFHDADLTAWVEFQEAFFTPADVDGLTLEGLHFRKRGDYKPLGVDDVPLRIFSEVMRDLDLVVSVAHRGGVDPEASASTIEMRSSLLEGTCELLGLNNVTVKDSHAFIKGKLGEYNVHLGSAVAHRQPGGALFIVAVHSQHRGRLFLPFADDDPKTAEVLSKVILLAEDEKIQDPNILDQIRGSA